MEANYENAKTGERVAKIKIDFVVTGDMIQKAAIHFFDIDGQLPNKKELEAQVRRLLGFNGERWFDDFEESFYSGFFDPKPVREHAKKLFPEFFNA